MQCLQQDLMDSPAQPACCRVSLTEICSLYQRLFQTPADINAVQAAVDQVCGVRLHSAFCCSSRLLDVLVEVERRRWVKEQIYWDFQLLDFNRDSSLSLSDVKILLQRAQESQITSNSWVDFLTQRQETSGRVTWSELEAWLFEKTPPSKNERTRANLDPVQYQEGLRKEKMRLKMQWDSGGLVDLVRATGETDNERRHHTINQDDLTEAVELKYAVLSEKLFCDMLQAHYGAQVWASMNAGQKERNLNEFKMLAQFGLEKGSELVLSQLPGATHNFREEDSNCNCEEVSQTWTAVQGLKELQRRLELERMTVAAEGEGSPIPPAHHYFLLFAQTNRVKMESNFRAAVLVVEPHWEHRFWDGTPMCPGACYEELAHIRLTTGQRIKSKLEKPNLQKMPIEEDKLLSLLRKQEEARDLLFQLLQSCSHKELQEPLLNLLHNKSEEHSHPIEEISGNKVARNPLRDLFLLAMTVTKTCLQEDRGVVTWGDCAVRLLVQVQLKQELELRELIQDLVNGLDSDLNIGHQTIPNVVEERDPVSDLIRLLQPLTPQEHLGLNQLNIKLVSDKENPIIAKDPCMEEQYIRQTHDITEAETFNEIQTGNKSPLAFLDSTNENITDKINEDSRREQNEFQEIRTDGWTDPKKTQAQVEKACYHGQNNRDYRNTVTDSSSQTEFRDENTKSLEHVQDTNLPENHVCKRKEMKSEKNMVHGNDAVEILSRVPGKDIHQMRKNEKYGKDEKNRHVHEQVPQNQLATSVLDATEGLIAGLMTLKVRVEQVYMMREAEGNPFQKPPNNIIKEIPLNAQVSDSQNKTPVEKNTIPKAMEEYETSSYEKETQPKPCKNIYCNNEGEGTQTEGYESHPDSVEHRELGTIQGKQKAKEQRKSELISLSCGAETNQINDSSMESNANMHGPSAEISSEQVASAVMEAADNLIGSLKTLKEEISRASQSQITKQMGETSTVDGYKYLEDTPDNTRIEMPPSLKQVEYKSISEDKKMNKKSLEDEAVQTYEDDSPHVPEPLIREVSWEVHPECSQGCSHAKLWDSEPDSEHITIKNVDSGITKTEETTGNKTGDFQCGVEKKQLERLSSDPLTQSDDSTKNEHIAIKDQKAVRYGLDHEEGDHKKHALVTSTEEPTESSSTVHKEHGEDKFMADSSKYGCTEPDSADKLALSFLEAAQNLIGGLIPGKEEVVGRVVVILTDGTTSDGDAILEQGEEFSEASGTISILEGSSGDESQDTNLSKEERDDLIHEPIISEKGTNVLDGNDAEPLEECPGGHCTRKTEMTKWPDVPHSGEIEKMTCPLNGCEGILETPLVKLQNMENEEEIIILATEEALTESLCEMANEPNLELYIKIKADNEDGVNKPVIGLQNGNGEETKCNLKEGKTIDNVECFDNLGCEKLGLTVGQGKTSELNSKSILEQKSFGENITPKTTTRGRGDPVSQAENEMNKSIMMTTTTDREGGEKIMHTRSRDQKESEGSKTYMQYTEEGKSTYEELLEKEDEENLCRAEEDNVTIKPKTADELDGKKEEHKDLHPYRNSPDTLVRNVLLATQDLIGSLTSLKDSMGNNIRAKSLAARDNISNKLPAGQMHDQDFAENTIEGDYQFCATLDFQRNEELLALGHLNITCDPEKSDELTGKQDNNISLKGNKEHQCTMEDEKEMQNVQQSELHSGVNSTIINRGKLSEDKSSPFLLQENNNSSQSNTNQRIAEKEDAEQSTFVPSIVGVSAPPASPPSGDKELHFAYMEPDLVLQDSKNLKNRWRSISENQILKSRISERLKVKVIEKSKSDSASHRKRVDPPIQVIPGTEESEHGRSDQLCLGNEDTKTEEDILRTTKEHIERKIISTENTEDESRGPELNDPGSLKDLTVSLLEATGSLIGRLSSLKAELGNSQNNVISRNIENMQSMHNYKEYVNETKTSDGMVMAHLKQTDTVANDDEVQDNGDCIRNDNVIVYQALSEIKTDSKLIRAIITGTDEDYKKNIQVHGLPGTEGTQIKEKETNTGHSTGNLLIVQNEILNKDEELHPQKHMQTAIPDFPQDGNQQANMQTSYEDQVLQKQMISQKPVEETIINVSSVEELRNSKHHEHHTEDTTEELKASYNIQKIFLQHNLSDISKNNSVPERNEGMGLDGWIEEKMDEHVVAGEIQQVEEQRSTEEQESADMKDLSDLYSLRKHIKNEVTKKKSEHTEEKEEDKSSCSHEQIVGREHVDKKGKRLGLDNFKLASKELAGNDDDLPMNTELPINNKSIEKRQTMQTESKAEMYLMNCNINENMEQKQENFSQEGKKDMETRPEQPAPDCDIERGAKTKDALVKRAESRWLQLKEEACQTLAETVQSDEILNDMVQVPANGVLVRNEAQLLCPVHTYQPLHMLERPDRLQDILKPYTVDSSVHHMCSLPLGQAALQREKVFIRLSLREQQEALQRLHDLQREAELKCNSDRRRQMLRFQERLSIARNRKSEVDLMDVTQRRSPQMTPEPLPEGDTERQKSAVRERLEKMKRERTYIMQTRRDRNMSSFRELLDPVLAKNKREDSGSELRGAEGM